MMTNCPIPIPEIAMLFAIPRRSGNQRLTITPMGATEVPAVARPNSTPYSIMACNGVRIILINAMLTLDKRSEVRSTVRML